MMGSRVRDKRDVKRLLECYMVITPPWSSKDSADSKKALTRSPSDFEREVPEVKSIYPANYNRPDVLKSAAQFAFPCYITSTTVELFTFVLTGEDSKWTFGYCRHQYGSLSAIVILTFLPWQEIFYRILNYCAEISEEKLGCFLEKLHSVPVPEGGTCLYVPTNSKPFICPCPSDLSLPSIPENRNVSEFYNALSTDSMLVLFSSLLSERRIVVTSKKLSRLSSIVVACNLFLFPMSWQHIFIPVLPHQLQDYLSAPMPFLIGVPLAVWDRLPSETLGQLVRVDADSDTVSTPFPEDLDSLPLDVIEFLRKNLAKERVLGDGLARAFLRALAQIMGHYQEAIRDGEKFDPELFVQFSHPSHRHFISSKLLRLQIFQQFIEERIQKIKAGECESDEFELEALGWKSARANGRNGFPVFRNIHSSQHRVAIKRAGKAVIMSVKRESGNIIDSVKQNSTLKSAFRSVKESSKSVKQKSHIAVSDIKSKFNTAGSSKFTLPLPETSLPDSNKSYSRQQKSFYTLKTNTSASHIPSLNSLAATDENLINLMSLSSSASKMNDLTNNDSSDRVHVKPRLSRSEENLIDLDSPPNIGLGYTLANPLYELENSVFIENDDKTDAQLLHEYGLSDYFDQMNLSGQSNISQSPENSGMIINPSKTRQIVNTVNTISPAPAVCNNWAKFD